MHIWKHERYHASANGHLETRALSRLCQWTSGNTRALSRFLPMDIWKHTSAITLSANGHLETQALSRFLPMDIWKHKRYHAFCQWTSGNTSAITLSANGHLETRARSRFLPILLPDGWWRVPQVRIVGEWKDYNQKRPGKVVRQRRNDVTFQTNRASVAASKDQSCVVDERKATRNSGSWDHQLNVSLRIFNHQLSVSLRIINHQLNVSIRIINHQLNVSFMHYQSSTKRILTHYQSSTKRILTHYQSSTKRILTHYQSSTKRILTHYQSSTKRILTPFIVSWMDALCIINHQLNVSLRIYCFLDGCTIHYQNDTETMFR